MVNYIYKRDDFKSISSNYINTIYLDKLNNLWIGTQNGLNKFNWDRNNFTKFQNDLSKPLSLINNNVYSICEDKTGLMWLGTSGGVSKFCQTQNKFFYYKEDKINPEKGLSNSNINSLFIDKKNNIWVGTNGGLDIIQNSTKQIVHLRNNPQNINSLNDNEVKSVLIDRSGIVWIGTAGGLNRYDPSTGKFSFYRPDASDPTALSNNGVISLCQDYKGNLWAGTWWGLNCLDNNDGKFIKYHHDPNNPNTIGNDLIWAIYQDSQKMLWIGTDAGGVSCFNPNTNTFKNFVKDSLSNNSIIGNKVVTIYETHDGVMWFGTQNGLSSYDRFSKKFKNYNLDSGLPSLIINGIIEDKNGFLWISTDKGLSKFNRKTGIFSNFNKRNGLRDTEFSTNVLGQSNNILYFGGKYSLVYFNPDNINDDLVPVPVVFTDLKIFNRSVPVSSNGNTLLNESITFTENVNIPSSSDIITLDFALLDYFNVKTNTFKYKLSGFDVQWNNVGTRNNATYTNLQPGSYVFYVKAINNNDKRSEKEASIKITVVPTIYQTLWFKIFSGIILIFIIFLLFNIRTRTIQKQNKILEGRVLERTKDLDKIIKELSLEILERKKAEEKVQGSLEEKEVLLKEIHHRVKNNLQIISSLLYLQSKSIKDQNTKNLFQESQNRIRSMSLIHEKLYQSKDFSGISFCNYVKSLLQYLEQSFNKKEPGVKIQANVADIKLSLDTAISCGLIINELVTNAYKYAFPQDWVDGKNKDEFKIEVNVHNKEDDKFILIVSDNGVGIQKNLDIQNTESLGLKLVNSMVNQLNGSIEIIRNNGTQFRIIFTN